MKHKKFKRVGFNNRRKVFVLEYTTGLKLECPYSSLGITQPIISAAPDKEVGNHSFYFVTKDGNIDYVPYDQPLSIAQHPEFIKQELLFNMTQRLNELIAKSSISKRELARRLSTSLSQLERIIDPTNYKKNLSTLVQLAAILNYELNWKFTKAA